MSFLSSEIGVRDFKKYSKYSFFMVLHIYDAESKFSENIPNLNLYQPTFLQNYINMAMFLIYDGNGLEALCDEIE